MDNGNHWEEIINGLTHPNAVYCFAFDSSDHVFAGAAEGEIYHSVDNGENWIKISNGFTTNSIQEIAVNVNNNIFVSPHNEGVYRSTDNGLSWEEINNGLTNHSVYSIKVNSENVLFASTYGGGVYRSSNNGDNWEHVNNGLASLYTIFLEINSYDYIFVTTGEGVYRSTDAGNEWIQINSGLGNSLTFLAMAINPSDYIFVVTYPSNEVYRSVNPTTGVVSKDADYPSTCLLAQNYPNPFNPSTTISYQIPQLEFVLLKVYDILGREVSTLVNEEKPAGNFEVQFEGNGLTSGIYFYQLKVGDYLETKKMILLR